MSNIVVHLMIGKVIELWLKVLYLHISLKPTPFLHATTSLQKSRLLALWLRSKSKPTWLKMVIEVGVAIDPKNQYVDVCILAHRGINFYPRKNPEKI